MQSSRPLMTDLFLDATGQLLMQNWNFAFRGGCGEGGCWSVAPAQKKAEVETWIPDQSCSITDRAQAQNFIDSTVRLTQVRIDRGNGPSNNIQEII